MNSERDRLKDLLVILLEEITMSPGGGERNAQAIQDKVVAAGLDEADVNGLLDWIESHWHPGDLGVWSREFLPDSPSAGAFRVFGEGENSYLTADALGFLIELLNNEQINRMQMEALMQYAAFIAIRPLEKDDLESVIEQVLFRPRKPGLTGGASEGYESKH
ncbi:MAG: DUF494 domain-containing protein [Gemmatimonadales bacterium]|nr:DUF494 domain-containing protein [Gemmatimonadales bacterium]